MYAMSETVNHSPSSDMRSKSSTKASSKSRMTAEDLAAMRHLRSVIRSITLDENISPSERKRKVSDFNHLLIEAEQRLHYHASHLTGPFGRGSMLRIGLVIQRSYTVGGANGSP